MNQTFECVRFYNELNQMAFNMGYAYDQSIPTTTLEY